jgi:hypothetical protein
MNDMMVNFLSGAGIGAVAQGLSEVLKLGHGVVDMFKGVLQANNEAYRQNVAAEQAAFDAAAKRGTPWLRGTLAIIAFVAAFGLSYVNGWVGTGTSVLTDREPWLNLFGLLKFGGGMKVVEAQGFVLPPEFWQTITIITGAIFGIMGVRTGKTLR